MMAKFDELVEKRRQLKLWWSLRDTVADYENKKHTLRVDLMKPTMVAFCGQQYAGAKNYHDAPEWFKDHVKEQMETVIDEVTCKAYEEAIECLDDAIDGYREQVLQELGKA